MAYYNPDEDCDSTFGEACTPFWTDPMFTAPSPPLAGTKRVAGDGIDDSRTAVPGATDTDPRALCCHTCPEQPVCEADPNSRPLKRRALESDLHHTSCEHLNSNVDHQFLDTCFQEFCQGCDFEEDCTDSCALPCPGEGACSPAVECCPGEGACSPVVECCPGEGQCSPEDACWSPHCEDECEQNECADKCVDPECSKISCPNVPCFCGKCDAKPCPLGGPSNECHQAHSAPTASGTIYCFDNAPCHFQPGDQFSHTNLPAYDNYQCFSSGHVTLDHVNGATHPSTTATPALSPGNYTSLASLSTQSSPTLGQSSSCFLNTPFEHCHINESCCHGPSRDCGEYPTAPQNYSSAWDAAGGNLFLTNYGHVSQTPNHNFSTTQPGAFNGVFAEDMFGFNTTTWTFPDSHYSSAYTSSESEFQNKMDSLTLMTHHSVAEASTALPQSTVKLQESESTSMIKQEISPDAPQSCICCWEHSPDRICLQSFPTPEALHKHIKTEHVDPCTRCFCQWTNCDSSGKDFKQRSKLSRHLLGHAGHRPYSCSFDGCTKTFATNQAKDNHERTHTGDRPYVCDRCGYTTTTHTQLQTHISALHEGKKPFKCRHCDFVCADSSNLSKHERTHQTLRPYRCPHLGCTFKPDCRWENLKRHLRRSGHCPEFLNEGSEAYKLYREGVRKEIEEFHSRNEDSKTVVGVRRKGIKKE
ncbi:hypothetical protein P154DRAFT_580461 [Amniculicola lignicola CBS 123094]|uniref:C2H2-type domain-containing protein n=1 Tax=Amniculicola lignicola CBS 123094 TaxID=1392246 RepID=A0A6A5W4C3_9PLEO|nr:hypothetical protein P154DRAFT_580461 [Amniculicola lignicola CBS 123094]